MYFSQGGTPVLKSNISGNTHCKHGAGRMHSVMGIIYNVKWCVNLSFLGVFVERIRKMRRSRKVAQGGGTKLHSMAT